LLNSASGILLSLRQLDTLYSLALSVASKFFFNSLILRSFWHPNDSSVFFANMEISQLYPELIMKDKGNEYSLKITAARKLVKLGHCASSAWHNDPKRLLFVLARYKFAAQVLSGSSQCLEIGCGDGFASKLVKQTVDELVCVDYEQPLIDQAKSFYSDDNIAFKFHDILSSPVNGSFDSAFCLDVLEHIDSSEEHDFMRNISSSLTTSGAFLVGMPSLHSQKYASEGSRLGHVNCKTKSELYHVMSLYFARVFMFSMNDEVVHTGFGPMSHYIFALGVCPALPK
jgi:SAM-dependent methyltransferase